MQFFKIPEALNLLITAGMTFCPRLHSGVVNADKNYPRLTGSYKTAGALADDFLREAKAGRVIVTNVRGLSRERTLEQFPDLPLTFDVIHVDDKTSEGRKKWATWFHWMPHGAFIFLDEVQDLWPKSWREADIRKLDYPGGVDQATKMTGPKIGNRRCIGITTGI